MKKGIDLFIKNIDKTEDLEKHITFYGGEPLLCFDIVKFAIEYLRKEEALCSFGKKGVEINIITNGSLVTEDIAKFFKDFNIGVTFSLDGQEIDNDKTRQYPDGRGTFKDVVKGLKNLQKYSCNVGICFTVGIQNVLNLMENVKFLVEELGVKVISYNVMHDLKKGKNPAYVDVKLVIENIMKTFPYLEEKGIFDEKILRRWDSFIEKRYYFHDCGACGSEIVLLPDEYIGSCHVCSSFKKYCIPFKEDIDFRKEPIWQEWARRSPFNMPQCKGCNLISICGGGCPYSAMVRYGSIWDVDKDHCYDFISKILELYIWKVYDRMKDLPQEKEEKRLFPIPITKWV
ncbi:MAG: radical SAM protein [bacterium]